MNIKIIDNLLNEDAFIKLHSSMEDLNFPWFFNKDKDDPKKDYLITQFQFTHSFFNGLDKSYYYDIILPIVNFIVPKLLIRVKANLNPYSQKIVEGEFHKDTTIKDSITAIYYVNSNNGYTLIKKKNKIQKIDSIKNRLVLFDSSLLHAGTNSTNCKNRMVININYIK
jgi:hypothetical protein